MSLMHSQTVQKMLYICMPQVFVGREVKGERMIKQMGHKGCWGVLCTIIVSLKLC